MVSRTATDDLDAWKAADAVFDGLLDLPPGERAAALEGLALEPAVRERVRRLLAADASAPTLESVSGSDLRGRRVGRWLLESEIGRGGMSVVFRAHAVDAPDRLAALKLITLGALAGPGLERFRREQAILSRLSHPHIATLLEAGTEADGTPWLAMALVDGIPIDRWCEARGVNLRGRVRLLLDVCAAVAHAHRALVVHRDLKPSNVLVDTEGHVRLLDFGIARLTDSALGEATATHWRALSPGYAAPEQFEGAVATTAMDVFGLGALMYALLCGHPPRDAHTPASAITAPSQRRPGPNARRHLPAASQLRGDLDAIALRALADDPAARYPAADALADDLRLWLDGRPVSARGPGLVYRVGRFLRRRWLAAAMSTAALAALLAISVLAVRGERAARAEAAAAAAARAETDRALVRARALSDFLIGVFETQAPGRPRSELPATAELLAEGETLALGAELPIEVRADLLDAFARIRLARGDVGHAQPLIERLMSLAEETPSGSESLAARALLRRSNRLRLNRDFAAALADLDRASALAAPLDARELLDEIEVDRASLLLESRRFDDALAALTPLLSVDGSTADARLPERLRTTVHSAMGMALGALGQVEQSQGWRERVLSDARARYGPRHFRVAAALGNAANGNRLLGRFEQAEQQLQEAVSIYSEVLDGASEYRGSALLGQGWLALARGRFDEAVAAFDAGNAEIARARGIGEPADYAFFHWNRGLALAGARRTAEAVSALSRAEALLGQNHAAYAAPISTAAAWLAILQCRSGELDSGRLALTRLRESAPASLSPQETSLHAEARAQCLLAAGDAASAQEGLAPALTADESLPQGLAGDAARRLLLAAAIADASGAHKAAADFMQRARRRLQEAGLDGHPLALQ